LKTLGAEVRAMSSFVGFLSGADKYGRWVPESEVTASAYLGGATVDFSQALFQHPVITIQSTAFMGSVTIIIPPGVVVEQDGAAIFGGFGDNGGIWSSSQSSGLAGRAPVTLRVVGTAMMGRVNVVVNHRAPAAELHSPEEVARILREVPPSPSTTVSDVLGQAFQQQAPSAPGVPGAPQADPRQALLQGMLAAHAAQTQQDPRAAALGAALNAYQAQAQQAQAQQAPQMQATGPVQGLPTSAQSQPVVQGVPVAAGGPSLKELD